MLNLFLQHAFLTFKHFQKLLGTLAKCLIVVFPNIKFYNTKAETIINLKIRKL